MAAHEDWSVPNSDDERDEALINLTTSVDRNTDIPIQILHHYQDIEKKKVLELKVKEFRTTSIKDADNSDGCSVEESCEKTDDVQKSDGRNEHTCNSELGRSNQPSEFDYLDEPEDCQGQIPKRTPKFGRLPKKRVGTLKNVISNLKRFRELNTSSGDDIAISGEGNVEERKENNEQKELTADDST